MYAFGDVEVIGISVILKDWWKGCQALGCIGAVAVFIGWLCLMCWLCQKRENKSTKMIITGFIFAASKPFVKICQRRNINRIYPASILHLQMILRLITKCMISPRMYQDIY